MSALGQKFVKYLFQYDDIGKLVAKHTVLLYQATPLTAKKPLASNQLNIVYGYEHSQSSVVTYRVYDNKFKEILWDNPSKPYTTNWLNQNTLGDAHFVGKFLTFDLIPSVTKEYQDTIKLLKTKKKYSSRGYDVGYVDNYSDGTPCDGYVLSFNSKWGTLSERVGSPDDIVFKPDTGVRNITLDDFIFMTSSISGGLYDYKKFRAVSPKQQEYMERDPEFVERGNELEDEDESLDYEYTLDDMDDEYDNMTEYNKSYSIKMDVSDEYVQYISKTLNEALGFWGRAGIGMRNPSYEIRGNEIWFWYTIGTGKGGGNPVRRIVITHNIPNDSYGLRVCKKGTRLTEEFIPELTYDDLFVGQLVKVLDELFYSGGVAKYDKKSRGKSMKTSARSFIKAQNEALYEKFIEELKEVFQSTIGVEIEEAWNDKNAYHTNTTQFSDKVSEFEPSELPKYKQLCEKLKDLALNYEEQGLGAPKYPRQMTWLYEISAGQGNVIDNLKILMELMEANWNQDEEKFAYYAFDDVDFDAEEDGAFDALFTIISDIDYGLSMATNRKYLVGK